MRLKIYRGSESDLIDGCKKGVRSAQKRVYEQFSGKMYALACRYIKDQMAAEDVVIVSFTKVFEKVGQFKSEGSFEGWVRRIVVNECLSYLRRNKSMYIETEIERADMEPDYQRLESGMGEEELLQMIAELPTGYRIVFNLYVVDGYSHKEIALQLGISDNTSKSQLSRARSLLQRRFLEMEKLQEEKVSGYDEPIGPTV